MRRLVTVLAFVFALLGLAAAPAKAGHAPANDLALVDAARSPSGRVTIVAEPGLVDTARGLAKTADATLGAIEADLPGLPLVPHIEVRLVRRAESLPAAAPPGRGAPAWAVGVAYPELGVVCVAARTPDGALNDVGGTFAHELAHMVLERALGDGRAPRWLHEGFAYLHSSDFSLARAQSLAGAVFRRELRPLAELEHAFPARHDAAQLAYAQAYDFVAFLAQRGRFRDEHDDGDRWALRHFLQGVARGESLDQAAKAAFAASLPELEQEWIEAAKDRYFWFPIAALGGLFWVAIALLAVLAWRRRRAEMRRRLARMEAEEVALARAAQLAQAADEGGDDGRGGQLTASYATAPAESEPSVSPSGPAAARSR
jgi:hypothetical protein